MALKFRKKASEHIASPDQLDQLLRVVKPKNWLPLAVVGGFLVFALAWSIFGRIPVAVTGNAILVHPSEVFAFQAPATGQLVSLDVRAGQTITKGQVLGKLNLPDLKKQLEQARYRLTFLQGSAQLMTDIEVEQANKEKEFIKGQELLLKTRMENIEERARTLLNESIAFGKTQREDIRNTLAISATLKKALEDRVAKYIGLEEKGLTSEDATVDAKQRLTTVKLRMAELNMKLHEVVLRDIEARQAHAKQQDKIEDLELEREKLELRILEIQRKLAESGQNNANQAEEITLEINRLQSLVKTQGTLVSEHAGRILEVSVSLGSIVTKGQRLGAMKVESEDSKLIALAYFQIKDGKRIDAGMKARIAPSTVQREKFGSIRATIGEVSEYLVTLEATTNEVGNREMAQQLISGGNQIAVRAILLTNPNSASGYEWTSGEGPKETFTSGTTASIRVTVEERAPWSFILPKLREWLGEN